MTDFSEFKKVYLTAETLLCPIGHTLMVDPVLISNGRTYERSAIHNYFDYQLLMGNRTIRDPDLREPLNNLNMVPHNSLKNFIKQFVNTYENFQLPSGISLKEEEQTTEEKTVLNQWIHLRELCSDYRTRTTEEINIEEECDKVYKTAQTLISPISGQLMLDPVTISNGKTYDRFEIRNFFIDSTNAGLEFCDPITSELLSSATFIPDNVMDTLIKQFVEMYQNKEGEEWEPVVQYCNVYNAEIIEKARKLEQEEIERQRIEKEERAAHIRHSQREARLNIFNFRPEQARRQEARQQEARRQEARQQEAQEALRQEALRQEAPRRAARRDGGE